MKSIVILLFPVLAISFTPVIHETIQIDGIISKDEWSGANQVDLSSGGKLFILRNQETLYLGLKGNAHGWGHVYIYWNDSVSVLHASAALGDQLYIYDKDDWKLQKKFTWQLRESTYNDTLKQKQDSYFEKYGWCANNNRTGDKTSLEYKIDLRRFGNANVKVAALYTSDAKTISHYPPELNDNTLLEKLVAGNSPDKLHFNTDTWITIK